MSLIAAGSQAGPIQIWNVADGAAQGTPLTTAQELTALAYLADARVAVAGLVILRQRPGTAKGVIFVTLEDETGIVNVVVWRKIYEQFRRAVISGRLLRVTGRMQRAHSVTHVIAEEIEDISSMLDVLVRGEG